MIRVLRARFTIGGLFLVRCPAAIFRTIVAVVVIPLKSQFVRLFSHISEEVAKVFPPFANGYSPASVTVPMVVFGVGASSEHVSPNAIGGRTHGLGFVAMYGELGSQQFLPETSAAFTPSALEVHAKMMADISALTNAHPPRAYRCVRNARKHREPSEFKASDIKNSLHSPKCTIKVFSWGSV